MQVTASNYEEDTGRLTLQASLASDMYLASPYAEDYYQWEAKVSLTGQQGRTCTLTAGPGQPAWQQLQKEDGSARDVFASESLFTFDLETRGAVEEYDLYGTIQGTLTLTCRETVDGSTKDWEVEVPFTVEFPGDYYPPQFLIQEKSPPAGRLFSLLFIVCGDGLPPLREGRHGFAVYPFNSTRRILPEMVLAGPPGTPQCGGTCRGRCSS